MIKEILVWFLLLTSFALIGIATLSFVSILKNTIKKDEDERALAIMGVLLFWSVGGLFLFFAYLAS
jgi:hypothetical protein